MGRQEWTRLSGHHPQSWGSITYQCSTPPHEAGKTATEILSSWGKWAPIARIFLLYREHVVGLKTSSTNSKTEAVRVREKLGQHPAYTGKASTPERNLNWAWDRRLERHSSTLTDRTSTNTTLTAASDSLAYPVHQALLQTHCSII